MIIKLATFESQVPELEKEASAFLDVLKNKIKNGEISGAALKDLQQVAGYAKGRAGAAGRGLENISGAASKGLNTTLGVDASGKVSSGVGKALAALNAHKGKLAGGAILGGGALAYGRSKKK